MKSDHTYAEIQELKTKLAPLQAQLHKLERRHADELSQEFIAANGITRDQVEGSIGESKPWFGHIKEFVGWLGWHPGKPWAEWNGKLYRTEDLLARRMLDNPARFDDVPA